MVYQSAPKRANPAKSGKKIHTIKITSATKQILDSSKNHPRETYNELILKLVNATLRKFSFQEILDLARDAGLRTVVDDVIGGIRIFRAARDNLRLECIQDPSDSKVHATLVKSIPGIDYSAFKTLRNTHKGSTVRFSGDLNAVRILENPSRYDLDHKTAFKKLLEMKKEVGLDISYQFNNEEDDLKKIREKLDI